MTPSEPEFLVIESAADRVVLALRVASTLDCFHGHFPGIPILPGVVQIDWAMRFGARHLGLAQRVARDFRVKFRQVVVPDCELRLTLGVDRVRRRLSFEYARAGEVVSSGQVALEPE